MIPITINKKKYTIKSIDELNTKDFIELSKIKECSTVKYIAWQTGLKIDEVFFAVTSNILDKAIGKAPDITKLPLAITDYMDYKKTVETVGQRHQIEESKKEGFELLVFCLAVAQAHSTNIDDVNHLYDNYLTKPYAEILPAGFFFFKNYRHGRSKGQSFLIWLLELIRMWHLRNRLA